MRSICCGFAPGGASARWVISPSRMTRTLWQRPIVSSSVSEVSTMATPSPVKIADQLVDLLLGADIEAAGRVIKDENWRPRLQPSREHDLLLVAAAEVGQSVPRSGSISRGSIRPRLPFLARVDQAMRIRRRARPA